jgi:hypothetical protein
MVATSILPKIGQRNQNSLTNSPGWQASSGNQIIQCALADGEQLRSVRSAQKQSFFGAHRWLLSGGWWMMQRQFHSETPSSKGRFWISSRLE